MKCSWLLTLLCPLAVTLAEIRGQPATNKPAAKAKAETAPKPADGAPSKKDAKPKAPNASLKPEALANFDTAPAHIREMLSYALSLTEKNLAYQYSSSDPASGGMDCSGTVHHILQKSGWNQTPRQSNEMYAWVWKAGTFRAFNGRTMESFELKELKPGDLLFWTNTIGKTDRDPPVTHVMIYLGKLRDGGRPVMVGASDGRTYESIPRFGVSVFDFLLPKEAAAARFIGYAHLPPKSAQK